MPVINNCAAFLVELFQRPQNYGKQPMDVKLFQKPQSYGTQLINVNAAVPIESCQRQPSCGKQPMDVNAFVRYVNYAERYNLTEVLSVTPKRGTMYSIRSLKDAGIDKCLSTKIRMDIYEEKCKQYEAQGETLSLSSEG